MYSLRTILLPFEEFSKMMFGYQNNVQGIAVTAANITKTYPCNIQRFLR